MTTHWHTTVAHEFTTVLAQTRDNVKFVQLSYRFISVAPSIVDNAVLNQTGHLKSAYEAYMRGKSANPEDLYSSLLVTVCAAYERFIRQLLTAAVATLDNVTANYDNLPELIQQRHTVCSGEALARLYDPPRHLRINFTRIAKRLGQCVPGSKSFELNAEAFSMFMPNLDADSLEKVLARIGIKRLWDGMGESKDLQKFFGLRNTRGTAKACCEFLDEFIGKRNHIVHRGDGLQAITEQELTRTIDFFEVFVTALCLLVGNRLFTPSQRR